MSDNELYNRKIVPMRRPSISMREIKKEAEINAVSKNVIWPDGV